MINANKLLLPDSRLSTKPDYGSKMVDWELPNGKTVRLEAQLIYCANCGKEYGYVPLENTSFACYLCNKCFDKYGAVAGTYAVPDDEYNRRVAEEVNDRFGKSLSCEELFILQQEGKLGTALEKLIKESPYPTFNGQV